jgi:hypothetical protein
LRGAAHLADGDDAEANVRQLFGIGQWKKLSTLFAADMSGYHRHGSVLRIVIRALNINEVFCLDDDFRNDLPNRQRGLCPQTADHFFRLWGQPDSSDALIRKPVAFQHNGVVAHGFVLLGFNRCGMSCPGSSAASPLKALLDTELGKFGVVAQALVREPCAVPATPQLRIDCGGRDAKRGGNVFGAQACLNHLLDFLPLLIRAESVVCQCVHLLTGIKKLSYTTNLLVCNSIIGAAV